MNFMLNLSWCGKLSFGWIYRTLKVETWELEIGMIYFEQFPAIIYPGPSPKILEWMILDPGWQWSWILSGLYHPSFCKKNAVHIVFRTTTSSAGSFVRLLSVPMKTNTKASWEKSILRFQSSDFLSNLLYSVRVRQHILTSLESSTVTHIKQYFCPSWFASWNWTHFMSMVFLHAAKLRLCILMTLSLGSSFRSKRCGWHKRFSRKFRLP
jgi:hypothetical protein